MAWKESVSKYTFDISAKEWIALRNKCFKRDRFQCQRCRKKKRLTAHHIIPRDDGGGNYVENLVSLCFECHDEVEIEEVRTMAEIACKDDDPVIEREVKKTSNEEYTFERPDWHKWVYGGEQRPQPEIKEGQESPMRDSLYPFGYEIIELEEDRLERKGENYGKKTERTRLDNR